MADFEERAASLSFNWAIPILEEKEFPKII